MSRTLACLAFPHHVFRYRRTAVYRGRIVERLHPLFPGYVFVQARSAWDTIRDVVGIIDFLRRNDHITTATVETLLREADADGIIAVPEMVAKPRFKSGDDIVVRANGPLSGCSAVFDRLLANGQAIVLLPWLGRLVPATFDECDLDLAEYRNSHKRRRKRRRRSRASVPTHSSSPAAS